MCSSQVSQPIHYSAHIHVNFLLDDFITLKIIMIPEIIFIQIIISNIYFLNEKNILKNLNTFRP